MKNFDTETSAVSRLLDRLGDDRFKAKLLKEIELRELILKQAAAMHARYLLALKNQLQDAVSGKMTIEELQQWYPDNYPKT